MQLPTNSAEEIAGLIHFPMADDPGSAFGIDLFEFITRLKALYSHWNKHKSDLWSSSDVLAIATPPPADDLLYLKSSALHIWLLGYVFPETIMVFMQKQIHFLCSQIQASLLDAVKAPSIDDMGVEVVMHVKAENDDGSALMETIFHAIRAQSTVDGVDSPVVGYIAREAPEGNLLENWAEKLKNVNFKLGDATNGLSDLVAIKGKEELVNVKKTALFTRNLSKAVARLMARQHARAGTGVSCAAARNLTDLIAYKNVNDLPPPKDMMIQIDHKNEAVLFPIYGSMVPFHVSTIRTVSSQLDSSGTGTCYIRIMFNVPGTPFSPHDASLLKFRGSIYLKEVSFRSKDGRHISEVVQMVKMLRRQVLARESEQAERATLVTQEKIQLAGNEFKPIRLSDLWIPPPFGNRRGRLEQAGNKFKSMIRLSDLWIRPPFGGGEGKMPGTLEAQVDGFRFSTSRPNERLGLMFGNIKHAFFQPAENEMITLLHFHLHNHIVVGNKKTKEVQFYVYAYDPDERDRKNKINMVFQSFVNRVNDLWGKPQINGLDLQFDQPLRELGFHGVPYKSSAFIVPTSTCLVELIGIPFLVVTLGEIEIVNLERVGLGQKDFDMTIVFKDFKKDVLRIDSIPSTALDGIEEWLDSKDIKYYENRLNLNWQQILKTITDDPQSFIDDGCWEFLNLEATDSESEHLEESDQGCKLVESEEEDDDDDDSDDSEEEKGKTWEELEREATNADREKGAESDSDQEDGKRRKMKAFGKSRAGPTSSVSKRSKLR